eukprot:jgi/Botrbrau1/2390/Bobra.0395s0022.1
MRLGATFFLCLCSRQCGSICLKVLLGRRTLTVAVMCLGYISLVRCDRSGAASATSRAYTARNAKQGPPQVDYTHFAKMLAGMLVLREGGISEATRAIPLLAATSHHYMSTQVFLNRHPDVSRRLKNFTDFHSYKENLDLIGKIREKMVAKGDKIGDAITTAKDTKITKKIQEKIDKALEVLQPPGYQEDLDNLNAWLAKFHINVTPKEISAPNKFSNFADVISKTVTGVSVAAGGITWAPAVVAYGPVGISAGIQGLAFTPALFNYFPAVLNVQPQIAQIQPVLFGVYPDGMNIQPQGVTVAPNLFVCAPTGLNILPQGVTVAASGFVEASTAVNVQNTGISWGPVNHIIP